MVQIYANRNIFSSICILYIYAQLYLHIIHSYDKYICILYAIFIYIFMFMSFFISYFCSYHYFISYFLSFIIRINLFFVVDIPEYFVFEGIQLCHLYFHHRLHKFHQSLIGGALGYQFYRNITNNFITFLIYKNIINLNYNIINIYIQQLNF